MPASLTLTAWPQAQFPLKCSNTLKCSDKLPCSESGLTTKSPGTLTLTPNS